MSLRRGWGLGPLLAGPVLVWGVLAGGAWGRATDTPPPRPPLNVLLISLDTVRPDHLSCYGYHRKTTPHLDRIAKGGVLFTQAFSQAGDTFPSHLALFTSRYPTKRWLSWEAGDLDSTTETLTEILKQQGYATAAFTGFNKGSLLEPLLNSRAFTAFEQLVFNRQLRALPYVLFRWLIEHREEPFFLFLHGFDAHDPHVLPIPYDTKRFDATYRGRLPSTSVDLLAAVGLSQQEMDQLSLGALYAMQRDVYLKLLGFPDQVRLRDVRHMEAVYDAQLYDVDQGLGRVFQALENLDLMDRTLVVILSDHGEAFGEHGRYAMHHGLYDEITRMVLIVRDPRLERRRRQVRHVVQGIDVMPTILELLGLPGPPSAQGRSLVPLLRTGRDPGRVEQAVSFGMDMQALRTPRWTLIRQADGRRELYDRRGDPGERRDRSRKDVAVVAALSRRLEEVVPDQTMQRVEDPEEWLRAQGEW